jgi:hypothetical protein
MADIDILKQDKQDYDTYLGVVSLRKSLNEEIDKLSDVVDKQKDVISLVNERSFDKFVEEKEVDISDASIISIVSLMQEATFKVRLMNAMRDIVYPMTEALTELQNQKMVVDRHLHQEDVLYQQSIISAIENMKDSVETSLIRTLVLEYRQFTRNPVWSTLRLINAGLIKPLASTIGTILFGWKKTKSDTDRIVESVDRLREFMMTGQIDDRRSTFEKIIQGGLAGITGRLIGSAVGINEASAQRAEDKASRGEEATFLERLSKRFINDTIKRGRNDYGVVPDRVSTNIEKSMLVMFSDDGKEMKALYDITDAINRLSMKIPNIIDVSPDSKSFDFGNIFKESNERPLHVINMVADSKLDFVADSITDHLALQYKASTRFFDNDTKNQIKTINVVEKMLKNDLMMNDIHEDTERYSKKSLRELQGIRRTQIFQALMSSLGTFVSIIKTGISGLMGGFKSLSAAIITAIAGKKALDIASGATKLLPDGTNPTDNDKNKGKKGKVGAIAAAGALAGGLLFSSKAVGDDFASDLKTVVSALPVIGEDLANQVDNYTASRDYAKANGLSTSSVYFGTPEWFTTIENAVSEKTTEIKKHINESSIWNTVTSTLDSAMESVSVGDGVNDLKRSITGFYNGLERSVNSVLGKEEFIFDPKDKSRDPMYNFNQNMSNDVFMRKEPLSKEWFDQKWMILKDDVGKSTSAQTAKKWGSALVEVVNPDGVFEKTIEKWNPTFKRMSENASDSFSRSTSEFTGGNTDISRLTDELSRSLDQLPNKLDQNQKEMVNETRTSNEVLMDMRGLLEELNKNIKKNNDDVPPLAANIDSFIHRSLA